MKNSDVYIYMTDVCIWADKNHLGCSYCPCKQSAFALSLACLQTPCSFAEDNAINCLRRFSEALQATTGSKGTCGSWGLRSMVASTHRACVLDAQKMLLVSSGNTIRVASHPTPSAFGGQVVLMDSHCRVHGRREAVPQVCMYMLFIRV